MQKIKTNTILVVGIGNELRGDDAVGCIVAQRIKNISPKNTKVISKLRSGLELLDVWQDFSYVMLVDAVQTAKKVGEIHCWNVREKMPEWDLFGYSTHSISLAEAMELGKALGKLPEEILVYGIEGRSFELGSEICQEVQIAVLKLTKQILKQISELNKIQ